MHDPAFLALISDQELRRIIISGRPDLGMPSYAEKTGRPPDFRALTSAEAAACICLSRSRTMATMVRIRAVPSPRKVAIRSGTFERLVMPDIARSYNVSQSTISRLHPLPFEYGAAVAAS